jgi:hypothetical protein
MITCTGATQEWVVHAATQGDERSQEGTATAAALAYTNNRGDNDAHQWLVKIVLVRD